MCVCVRVCVCVWVYVCVYVCVSMCMSPVPYSMSILSRILRMLCSVYSFILLTLNILFIYFSFLLFYILRSKFWLSFLYWLCPLIWHISMTKRDLLHSLFLSISIILITFYHTFTNVFHLHSNTVSWIFDLGSLIPGCMGFRLHYIVLP